MLSNISPGTEQSNNLKKRFSIRYRPVYLDVFYIVSLVGILLSHNIISTFDIWGYPIYVYLLLFFPYVFGRFVFWWIWSILRFKEAIWWVTSPVYWVLGLLLLNIPYYINSVIRINVLECIAGMIAIFGISSIIYNYGKKLHTTTYYLQKFQVKPAVVVWIICIILVMLRQVYWGGIKGFNSISLDSFQNIHLAKILNDGHYALMPSQLASLFKFDSYTVFLVPLVAVAIQFFNWANILHVLFLFEIISDTILFSIRKKLFEVCFSLDSVNASIVSLIATFVSYFIINNPPILQNQNVVVILFTTFLYALVNNKYRLAIFTFVISIPFHFFIAPLFLLYGFFYLIFKVRPVAVVFSNYRRIINGIVVLTLSFFAFASITGKLQYWFVYLLQHFFDKPSVVSFALNYSALSLVKRIVDSFSPLLLAMFIVSSIGSLFLLKRKDIWVVYLCLLHIVLFLLPFEFFGRVMALFAIPFALIIYLFLKEYKLSNMIISSILSFGVVVGSVWWAAIVGTYPFTLYTSTFFSDSYGGFLVQNVESDTFKKDIAHNPNQVKVVSDYLTKHITEIAIRRTNDFGVYEDSSSERGKNLDILRSRKDSCELFSEKYQLIVISEKTIRYLQFPDVVITDSLINIFDARPADFFIQNQIENFQINTTGSILMNKYNGTDLKFILIQCH